MGFQIPPDAIGEFKLQATNGSAEYGRSGGGTAIFEVKSGTNQIHGTGYEYLRNTVLNAVPWMANATDTGCNGHACNPKNQQNEWGVTAGAPIRKDKAFIFGYYDGFKLIQSGGGGVGTIPSLDMQQGNLTYYPLPVYDPTLTVQANAIGAPLCGPVVCDSRNWQANGSGGLTLPANYTGTAIVSQQYFDRVTKLVLPYMPKPNVGAAHAITSNFSTYVANPQSTYEYGFKGDYVFNEKNRVNLYYGVGQYSTPNTPAFLVPWPEAVSPLSTLPAMCDLTTT